MSGEKEKIMIEPHREKEVKRNAILIVAGEAGLLARDGCRNSTFKIVLALCFECVNDHKDPRWRSRIWSIHNCGKCVEKITPRQKRYCLIESYRREMIDRKINFARPYSSCLSTFEIDYAYYALGRRLRQAEKISYEDFVKYSQMRFEQILAANCRLCSQGIKAELDDIRENKNCDNGCPENTEDQREMEKRCFISRASRWQHDPYRMDRIQEYY